MTASRVPVPVPGGDLGGHRIVLPAAAAAQQSTAAGSTTETTVIGLDLSLTSTGISTGHHTTVIRPKKLTGLDRLRHITTEIGDYLTTAETLHGSPIAVEGPSYGSVGPGQHERGGLWWRIVDFLDQAGYTIAVVPPSVLKKYATGKGNAGKDEVLLAASRRFGWFSGGNDEADALWLAAIVADLIGQPIVQMPAAHRAGLASKVSWIREREMAA